MDVSQISTTAGIEGIISQYMTIQRQPMYELEQKKSDLNVKLGMYKDLKTKLTALRSAVDDLKLTGSLSEFGARTVSSGDSAVVTAVADGAASNGSHLIKVLQLAKADTVVSDRLTSSESDVWSTVGSGTRSFELTINGETTTVEVNVSDGDTNGTILSTIASAINGADAGVSASVVNDSSATSKLVLRSDETGQANGISLSDVSGSLLSTLGMNDGVQATSTTGGYMYADDELDSKVELDGIAITHSSNTLEDVLPGVTVTLRGVQASDADPVQVNIEADTTTIKENLATFFEKYNAVVDYLKEKTSVDTATQTRGALAGDFTFANLRMNLRAALSSGVSSVAAGNPTRLSEVGITPDADGRLSITDSDDLDAALEADVSRVEDLFNSESGIAYQIVDLLTPFTQTGGTLDENKKNVNTKISNIDTRMDNMEKRLEWKETSYRKQFLKLQEAFDAVSSQQGVLSWLNSSLLSSLASS